MTGLERDLVMHYAPAWQAARTLYRFALIDAEAFQSLMKETDRQFEHDINQLSKKEPKK